MDSNPEADLQSRIQLAVSMGAIDGGNRLISHNTFLTVMNLDEIFIFNQ